MAHVQARRFLIRYRQWDWPLRYAGAELAVLEILPSLESETDFLQTDRWFESLTTLSPTRLQLLLRLCPSIKAKRLFGWFAERHQHAWFQKPDWTDVDLGSGKRALIDGGRYSKRWQITVPRALEHINDDGLEQPYFKQVHLRAIDSSDQHPAYRSGQNLSAGAEKYSQRTRIQDDNVGTVCKW